MAAQCRRRQQHHHDRHQAAHPDAIDLELQEPEERDGHNQRECELVVAFDERARRPPDTVAAPGGEGEHAALDAKQSQRAGAYPGQGIDVTLAVQEAQRQQNHAENLHDLVPLLVVTLRIKAHQPRQRHPKHK